MFDLRDSLRGSMSQHRTIEDFTVGSSRIMKFLGIRDYLPNFVGVETAILNRLVKGASNIDQRLRKVAIPELGARVEQSYFIISVDNAVAIPLKDFATADHSERM